MWELKDTSSDAREGIFEVVAEGLSRTCTIRTHLIIGAVIKSTNFKFLSAAHLRDVFRVNFTTQDAISL